MIVNKTLKDKSNVSFLFFIPSSQFIIYIIIFLLNTGRAVEQDTKYINHKKN